MTVEAKGNARTRRRRLLLIDDDPVVSDILLLRIAQSCPLVDCSAINEPVASPGYDIYVLDINFAGRQEGARLAEAISTTSPHAVIFVLSSFLEVQVLKRAIGAQCRGAFDKREPEDIAALLRAISEEAARELPEPASTAARAQPAGRHGSPDPGVEPPDFRRAVALTGGGVQAPAA